MDTPRFSYTNHFIENIDSAKKIVPIVLELIEKPQSVVDVGGGTGSWCKVFKDHGVPRVMCIDDSRIGREQLLVAQNEFIGCDLSGRLPDPIAADLAVCMEVVEHLPEAGALRIVEFLTRCADVVLFSAAIPGQPDVRHINEKSASYWRELFRQRGYSPFDVVRPKLLADPSISYWYRQNLFLYANESGAARVKVKHLPFDAIPPDFELVHERVLNTYRSPHPGPSGRQALKELMTAIRRKMGF